jgi:hypothetical protein
MWHIRSVRRYDLDVQFEAHRDELDKIKSLVADSDAGCRSRRRELQGARQKRS